jgi:two-component system KDP operon response regulator KdpE
MNNASDVRVLVVEDDPGMRRFLRNTLQVQCYEVMETALAEEALRILRQSKPELVILDLGLPDRDGMELIGEIRAVSAVPILVLSSRSDEQGKVTALDLGADDYVSKPFGVDELMARIRAALRHRLAREGSPPVFSSGGLTVDMVRRRVTVDGTEVHLSRKEYDILRELVVHAGKVLTHRHLLKTAWGRETGIDVQYLRVYVRQIRQKIEPVPEQPRFLLTEPGVGYRLEIVE